MFDNITIEGINEQNVCLYGDSHLYPYLCLYLYLYVCIYSDLYETYLTQKYTERFQIKEKKMYQANITKTILVYKCQ